MYRLTFIVIAVLAIGGGLLIGTLNAEAVDLDLLWVQLRWPLGLVVVVALALGVLLGVAATWVLQVWPMRLTLRRQRAAVTKAEASLDADDD